MLTHAARSALLAAVITTLLGACGKAQFLSVQGDPGTAGNGVEAQPAPYAAPAELTQRLPGVPAGTLSEPAFFTSKTYNLRFKYRIYVPAQYRAEQRAALMVFQDASSVYLGLMNTPMVLDNLIAKGEVPPMIALFLDPGTVSGEYVHATDLGKRSEQYDSMDDRYGKFLTEEIIPDVIQKRYKIVKSPAGWAIAGQSSGAVAAFTVAWHRPDFFRKVLTQNGSFVNIRGAGEYPELIRTELARPIRVYLLSGTNDLNNEFGSWLSANQAMARELGAREYEYRMRVGTGEHFPPLQAQADFVDALRWLWRGYSIDGRAALLGRPPN